MQSGHLVRCINEIHIKYGPIVRVAPNELSFISSDACRDIYAARGSQPKFPKNPVWMGKPVPRASGIVDANDEDHGRLRKVWGHAFTQHALDDFEPVLHKYVNVFIAQLRGLPREKDVDIVPWFNFLTFDLTGDLAFGESFNCLDGKMLHPWISMIFSHFKSATLIASIRFYPSLYSLLMWMLPASVLRKQQEHFQFSRNKVQQRLGLEKQRPDFMQHVIQHSAGDSGLKQSEIEKTAATMIVAGSETTGTLLSAVMSHLIGSPSIMDKLVDEIRSAYAVEEEMTTASLAKLPYLDAVIQETLRIAPPVPTGMPRVVPAGGASVAGNWLPENVSSHICERTLILSFPTTDRPQTYHHFCSQVLETIPIVCEVIAPSSSFPSYSAKPLQTFVSYAYYAAYHSPLNFSCPDKFEPSRWLSPSIFDLDTLPHPPRHRIHNAEALQPFSMGPRNCIGQKLAWRQTRLILGRLLWNFDVREAKWDAMGRNKKWGEQKTYTLWEKEGIWVEFKEVGRT